MNIPFHIEQIDDYGYHPFVTFYHNGRPIRALIDSGASDNFLNADFFEEIHYKESDDVALGMGSGFSVWMKEIKTIDFSGIDLPKFSLFKTDLSPLNASLSEFGFDPFDGILGSDFLIRLNARIEFENQQLWLENYPAIPMNYIKNGLPIFCISVLLNGNPLQMMIDTGASHTLFGLHVEELLFSNGNLESWKLNTSPSIGISPHHILNFSRQMDISFEDNISKSAIQFSNIHFTALIMKEINQAYQAAEKPNIDAILGSDFLCHHCKGIDFQSKMIYFL